MAIEERAFQVNAVNAIPQKWRQGFPKVLLVSPTGSGKTTMAGMVIERAVSNGRRVLMLAHRRRLIQQIAERAKLLGIDYGITMANLPEDEWVVRDINAPLQIASRDTLISRVVNKGWNGIGQYDLLIIDECFPAGTLVDGKPIESYQVGDVVNAFNEVTHEISKRVVTRVMSKPAPEKMFAIVAGGFTVYATSEHPFLTPDGWVKANEIKQGTVVFRMRQDVRSDIGLSNAEFPQTRKSVLHQGMREGGKDETCEVTRDVAGSSISSSRTDANQQPNEERRNKTEGIGHDEGNGFQTDSSGRQWQGDDFAGKDAVGCDGLNALCLSDTATVRGPSLPLQIGFSGAYGETSDRSGWPQSQKLQDQSCRQTERGFLVPVRVDSVAVFQLAGASGYNAVCPDNRVYNLEVEGEHTYLANGFAVHNCHRLDSPSYEALANRCGVKYRLGLTATPCRTNGKGLGKRNWDAIVEAASVRELVALKHLVPIKCFAPPEVGKLRKAGEKVGIAGDPVDHWKRFAEGRPTVVFTSRVDEAIAVRDRYRDAGISAEYLDDKTSYERREEILDDIRHGRTQVVTNVGILGEGVDVPELSVCQLLCRCGSLQKYLQLVGRIMRPAAGKEYGILLDHSAAVFEHGFPDEPQQWELSDSDDIDKRNKEERERGERADPVLCRNCGCMFAGVPTCPECGTPTPRKERKAKEKDTSRERLVEVSDGGISEWQVKDQQQRHWTYCLRVCGNKGWKVSRASMMFKSKFGLYPDRTSVEPAVTFQDGDSLVRDKFPYFAPRKKADAQ